MSSSCARVWFVMCCVFLVNTQSRDEQFDALMTLFSNTSRTEVLRWVCPHNRKYCRSTEYCTWTGIECDEEHRRVISIEIEGVGIVGTLPIVLNLTSLRIFRVPNNDLTGPLPPLNFILSENISVVHLQGNHFVGTLPQILGDNSAVSDNTWFGTPAYYDISSNELEGTVPGYFFDSTIPLVELRMSLCGLGGDLPTRTMPQNLSIVDMSSNQFTGAPPLCDHPMKVYYVDNNQFNLYVPRCKHVQNFRTSNNPWLCPLPPGHWIDVDMTHCEIPEGIITLYYILGGVYLLILISIVVHYTKKASELDEFAGNAMSAPPTTLGLRSVVDSVDTPSTQTLGGGGTVARTSSHMFDGTESFADNIRNPCATLQFSSVLK